jgi:eukaryotic-like serine/threonine-protein kinase
MLELAPGTTLGAYVITARIGRGGMATVYQAHHPALDRNVAIKVLWQSLAETPGFLERFRREARAASRLRHPNILTVYDFGEMDGLAYMVTELLPGGTLADRLGRPLPVTEVLRVLRGIGAALDAAHRAGLIHRDVKPSNILFTREGEPVLADFGIARLVEAEEQQLTIRGTMVGTPHYMAPEMATGEEVGPFSDLYSLGVVLHEMLTGEPPFHRDTPLATIRAHVHEPPPPVSTRVQDTPVSIDMVVARALAKEPHRRFRSGSALAAAFEDALLGDDPPTPRPGSIAPVRPGDRPAKAVDLGEQAVGPTAGATSGGPRPIGPWQVQPQDYGDVIPAPPPPGWTAPQSDTERWQGATARSKRRRFSPVGLIVVGFVALLATIGAFAARTAGLELPLPGVGRTTATRTPTAPSIVTLTATPDDPFRGAAGGGSATPGGSPAAGSGAAGGDASPTTGSPSPAAPPTPTVLSSTTPTLAPSATLTTTPERPTATPTLDPIRGPLAVRFTSPVDGATVSARPAVEGRKSGLQQPDEHLWVLLHPEGGPDNWWPYKGEILTDRDGAWRISDLEIGGPPGSRHVLAVGVVDATTHRTILEQIQTRQDEPFVGGQPPGFRELHRVTVVKR